MATSRGFGEFARRMVFRSNELQKSVDKLVQKISLTADQAIVLATPVDTGAARSNWLVSINTPRIDTIPPYAPGSKLGLGEGANAQGALSQAQAVTLSRKSGQKIFIVNNLPYIGRLNEGSSKQAPAGFINIGVTQAVNAVTNATFFPSP